MKPRVLHIIDGTTDGGTKVSTLLALQHLGGDYEFAVVNLGKSGRFSKAFADAGAKVWEYGTRWGRLYPFDFVPLVRLMRREKFALAHLHNFKSSIVGAAAASFCGIPYLIHDHSSVSDQTLRISIPSPEMRMIFKMIYPLALRRVNAVLVLNSFDVEVYVRDYHLSTDRIVLALNAIDLSAIIAQASITAGKSLRQELGIREQSRIALFAGRLTAQKDPMTFLRVAQRFRDRDVSFVFSGDGEMETDLREFTRRNGLNNVHFLGYRNDLPALMGEANALLFPSVSEPFGRVMLEAMAVGCPVVATECYGPLTVIRSGENGFLAPTGDDATIAKYLDNILTHPEQVKGIIESARATARQYDIKEYMQRMKGVYERAIGNGRQP